MAQAIPLVRAMALLPSLRWLKTHDLPVESMLRRRGLAAVPHSSPLRPVPLLSVGGLLRDIAAQAGPDAACRIVSDTSDADLVQIGRVALGTRSPSEALMRIAFALPYFCSHELLSIAPAEDAIVVRHAYGTSFEAETQHLMYQYALAVLDRICAMTGTPAQRFRRIEITPHPDHGVTHLHRWFGAETVVPSRTNALNVVVPDTVANRPFTRYSRDRSTELARLGLQPLRNDDGFSGSVRTLLAAMLEDEEGVPALAQVAQTAGLSTRTFQRRLTEEGMTFKSILDDVRREHATRLIADNDETVTSVAARLGYARPTSLNRSMLRWTGRTPTAYRQVRS